jgi:hypothetical protein
VERQGAGSKMSKQRSDLSLFGARPSDMCGSGDGKVTGMSIWERHRDRDDIISWQPV